MTEPHCTNEDNHAPHAVFCRNAVHVCAGIPVVARFDADEIPVCMESAHSDYGLDALKYAIATAQRKTP